MTDTWLVMITDGPFAGDYWPASSPEDAFTCVRELREDAARQATPLGTIEMRRTWRPLTDAETVSPPWTGDHTTSDRW